MKRKEKQILADLSPSRFLLSVLHELYTFFFATRLKLALKSKKITIFSLHISDADGQYYRQ